MIIFVLTAIAVIPVAVILARKSMGRTWALTPLALFILTSALFVNTGFIIYGIRYGKEDWAWRAVLVPTIGLLTVSVVGYLSCVLFGLLSRWSRYALSPSTEAGGVAIPLSMAVVVIGAVSWYFWQVGYLPLLEGIRALLSGGYTQGLTNTFRVNRDIYVNPDARYIAGQGFMEVIRYFGLPVTAILFGDLWRRGVRKRTSALMLLAVCLLAVASGQRWPLMYLIVAVVVYLSWSGGSVRRFKRTLAISVLGALAAGIGLSILLGRRQVADPNLARLIWAGGSDLLERILFGYIKVPFSSYALFPESEGFLLGGSWMQNAIALLPGPTPSFSVHFYQLVTGDSRGFTAPPDFFTEAYINFGMAGVVAISALWGIMLAGIQNALIRLKKTPIVASHMAVFTTILGFTTVSGIFFVVGGIIALTITWATGRTVLALSKGLKGRKSHRTGVSSIPDGVPSLAHHWVKER